VCYAQTYLQIKTLLKMMQECLQADVQVMQADEFSSEDSPNASMFV
jgi:hypothetical protein